MITNPVFTNMIDLAHAAGRLAAVTTIPTPMHLVQTDPIGPVETIDDGPCGFAWVQFKGNTHFGRWAKAAGISRNAYPTGQMIWISDYNQSMHRKEAHARAFARVLTAHGIYAYADSRMD